MTGAPRRVILGTVTQALPADVIAQIKEMDPAITPGLAQSTWALLTPFHEKLGYTAPRIDRDLAYGDHPRHRVGGPAWLGRRDDDLPAGARLPVARRRGGRGRGGRLDPGDRGGLRRRPGEDRG